MSLGRVLLVVSTLLVGCTKTNEEKYCTEQTCTTPDFPFCDVTGFASGEPGTCIAVTCTAGEFAECRGDVEVRCNETGTNYNLVQCERGCDASADGCRLCSPNETACTNGTVATCDASGAVVSKATCPLGCFEDQPRCRDIDPSNGLAAYLDAVQNPGDLDLSGGGTIVTETGDIYDSAANRVPFPSFLIPAPPNGAAIRVFIAGRVRLGNVFVAPGTATGSGGPALAIVADGEITVEGTLTTWRQDYDTIWTAGGVGFASCIGGPGEYQHKQIPQDLWSGGGGGGHATPGGAGGSIEFMLAGGNAGSASGSPTLEPLRCGCAGGGVAGGGGAIQLSSRTAITVRENAVINVNGGIGPVPQAPGQPNGGGGGGGGILLEAPSVTLEAGTKLLANGGPAAAGNDFSPPTSETTAVSLGGACVSSGAFRCGNGGNGAAADGPATAGAELPYTNTADLEFHAAGGGGGLGFVRLNTPTGSYTKANTTIESGVLTTGTLRTR